MNIKRIAQQHLVKDPARVEKVRLATRPDNGFYGPDSITWRVGQHPAAAIGLLRIAIEVLFDPHVAASVEKYSVMKTDPLTRARRTVTFMMMAFYGDSESAIRAARTLYRVHSHMTGHDPITGEEYLATDIPRARWTHALGIVAILDCYEMCGGRLTDEEKDQMVRENVPHAQLVGVDPKDVPMTLAECRQIVAEWMPRMTYGMNARNSLDFFFNPPMTPAWPMVVASPGLRVIMTAYARKLAPELKAMAQFQPHPLKVRAAELILTGATNALRVPALYKALMVISPEGYGMMKQALEAPRDLPLADPTILEDLHLVVRQKGETSVHSELEYSPFVNPGGDAGAQASA